MLKNSGRLLPKVRNLFSRKNVNHFRVQTPYIAVRGFYERRYDPFTQMEKFMRDMEKKFWGEVNQSFPWFPALPRFGSHSPTAAPVSKFPPNIWGPSDVSTPDKFKLKFSFPQAKADDIKVTLKDRLLSVEATVEESTETSKLSQTFSFQYTIPESVNVEALESIFTNDGLLMIEAPKTPEEAPKTINIKRE